MILRHVTAVLLGSCLVGCAFHYEPVKVSVLDAETGQGVPDATVVLRPAFGGYFTWAPSTTRGKTGADGAVMLSMAVDYKWGSACGVSADGYQGDSVFIVVGPVNNPSENHRIVPPDGPKAAEVSLFASPIPEVTFVLPDDLRGWVLVRDAPDPGPSGRRSPRSWDISFVSSRDVRLPADHALAHFRSVTPLRGRRASGGTICVVWSRADEPKPGEVAVWPLWRLDGGTPYFVGTRAEYQAEREILWPSDAPPPTRIPGKPGEGETVLLNWNYEEWSDRVRAAVREPPTQLSGGRDAAR